MAELTIEYEFVPGAHDGDPPLCVLGLAFDPEHSVPGSGLSTQADARHAAARRVRVAQLHDQLRQAGVTVVLRSSLDQPSAARAGDPLPPPTPYPLPLAPLRALVASVDAFLRAAEGLIAWMHAVRATDTLGGLAGQYTVTLPELAAANAEVDAFVLFAQGTLVIPVFVRLAQGQTLRQAGVTAEALVQGSMDVPLAEGNALSLASQPAAYALGQVDSLRHVAAQAHALPGSVATANADHPLTKGAALGAGGASLAAGKHDTLATMAQRFAALEPPVATTPGDLGTANQDVPGLFDHTRSATLRITDRLVTSGDTLRTITTGPRAPGTAKLVADNLDLPGIYPPAAALRTSDSEYRLQPGDTLGGVAARFGVDLGTLATDAANAAAPLTGAHGCALVIPGQAVFGPSGPPASVIVPAGTPSADLLVRNRCTQDLLVAGSLVLGGVTVAVLASDLLDAVWARAVSAGYAGDFAQFATDAAAAIAGGAAILASGAAWAAPPLTVAAGSGGATAETLAAVAARAGVTTDALIRSNGALRGVLRAGAAVTLDGVTVPVGADDTLATLAARLSQRGAPLTLDTLSQHNELTQADMLAAGAPLVPAPFTVGESVTFTATPENPGVIFAVDVELELSRPADERVVLATTRPAPRAAPGDDAARALAGFAEHFEAAFPGLKAAATRREDGGTGRLWAADFRSGKLGFAVQQGDGTQPNPHAAYFALPPPARELLSCAAVPLQPYTTGEPLGAPVPSAFGAVDLDAWMREFLGAVDRFLAAAPAARAPVDQVVADKQRIAGHLAGAVEPVFDGGPSGDLAAAQDALRRALLVSLGSAYGVSTIAQLPVTVSGPAPGDPATAPRLWGAP